MKADLRSAPMCQIHIGSQTIGQYCLLLYQYCLLQVCMVYSDWQWLSRISGRGVSHLFLPDPSETGDSACVADAPHWAIPPSWKIATHSFQFKPILSELQWILDNYATFSHRPWARPEKLRPQIQTTSIHYGLLCILTISLFTAVISRQQNWRSLIQLSMDRTESFPCVPFHSCVPLALCSSSFL